LLAKRKSRGKNVGEGEPEESDQGKEWTSFIKEKRKSKIKKGRTSEVDVAR
jgi:hypothetical protein